MSSEMTVNKAVYNCLLDVLKYAEVLCDQMDAPKNIHEKPAPIEVELWVRCRAARGLIERTGRNSQNDE